MNLAISSSSEEESSYNAKEQDRILKNSNIFKQKANSHLNCLKHPNKKAKYYAQNDKRTFFCSKCALNLALKGHKIEESAGTELEFQRQMRINQFQELMKQTLLACNSKIIDLNNLQISQKQLLEDQKTNCIKFFEQVIETAQQLKLTYIQKFQHDHSNLEQNILDCQQAVTNYEKQLQQFQIDIEKNHTNIVKKMEMKPFDDIMQRYEKRVRNIQQLLSEMKLESGVKINQFDQSSILTFMNKMCYNILLNDTSQQSIKSRSNSINFNNPSIDMKKMTISTRAHSRTQLKIAIAKIHHLQYQNCRFIKVMDLIQFQQSRIQEERATLIPQKVGIIPISKIVINNHKYHNRSIVIMFSLNEQPIAINQQQQPSEKFSVQEIVKLEQPKNLEITPLIHQKSQTILPQSIKIYNSQRNQYDSNTINKSQDQKQRKKQPSVDQIEQKRFYILNQNQQKPQSQQQEDTLKDRIFKELSGHSSESVYNQVLKINTTQQKTKKGKENTQIDWTGSLRNKQNLLAKK
ncbi:unnamed protein product (macronuclear) [Paramecium tetraurelia]|uniref:Uncharacterized protein n=1 Tax=Paramecium tetraurelia TaxID=5888 RepID=A0BN30_PARTE|nr:uncharacterized protein GSPATT00030585001 [Paramecium tetraurelia]CAK59947.1 unnamed protein product [Paramecium tetraurelia]|eukprot:XP_001427345.1 hypothetical protein (macronuclear) [Paramecium tetraurelia strain d4-2]